MSMFCPNCGNSMKKRCKRCGYRGSIRVDELVAEKLASKYEKLGLFERRERLVERLKEEGVIFSKGVERAFLKTPREWFLPEKEKAYAYVDEPIPIGFGQTSSQPYIIARMLELLEIKKGEWVLEVGVGSGYVLALLSEMGGKIFGIERIPGLVNWARYKLRGYGIIIFEGDGTKEVFKVDKILASAALPTIPKPWKENCDFIVAPLGSRFGQHLCRYVKGKIECFEPCVFVPMIGAYGFKG